MEFRRVLFRSFVERVERLEEEKKALSDDIRDVYAEAKANGFDVKALRQVVRLRKQDKDERAEQEKKRDEERVQREQQPIRPGRLVVLLLLELPEGEPGEGVGVAGVQPQRGLQRLALLLRHDPEVDLHRIDAGDLGQGRRDVRVGRRHGY